jgi:hypothetical protein
MGDSEGYLDKLPLKKDYWRLTTQDSMLFIWVMCMRLDGRTFKKRAKIDVSSLNLQKNPSMQ